MCRSKKVSKYFYRGNIDEALDVIGDSRIWMRQQLDGIVVIAKMLASFYLYEKDETKN